MDEIVIDENIILRKAKIEDASSIFQNIWSDDTLNQYMIWSTLTDLKQAKERLKMEIVAQRLYPYRYFIACKDSDEVIGFAGMRCTGNNVYEETGICIAKAYQNKGLGLKILRALLKIVFEKENGQQFIYHTCLDNAVSVSLSKKVKMDYLKTVMAVRTRDNQQLIIDYYYLDREKYMREVKE